MSANDFCGCTPEQFGAIYEAWYKREEDSVKDSWERMRLLATISIQPHVTKRIAPKDILTFAWDENNTKTDEKITIEERRKRFKELTKKLGDKL